MMRWRPVGHSAIASSTSWPAAAPIEATGGRSLHSVSVYHRSAPGESAHVGYPTWAPPVGLGRSVRERVGGAEDDRGGMLEDIRDAQGSARRISVGVCPNS